MPNTVVSQVVAKCFPSVELDFRRWFTQQVEKDALALVFTPNPEQTVLAVESESFRNCLLSGDQLIADGVGLIWAARRLGRSLTRITGVDTLSWWLETARKTEVPTLLVGGRSGVAELLAKRVDPAGGWCWGTEGHINVAAAHHAGTREQFQQEEAALFDLIRHRRPKVLFVAFGAPWQEEFLCRHHQQLQTLGVRVAMVSGGSFDYLAGVVSRAPRWARALGLEWLYRLRQEPWRWRRQMRLVRFLRYVLERGGQA